MSAAVITIVVYVVMLVVILVLLWVIDRGRRDRDAYQRELEAIRRSQQLAAEQSRAHARADERQWRDDVPARIWRNK
jgi:hypothetical protein